MDETGRIARAAGVIGFFTLLSRIMGLLRDMAVGYLFGAQGVADAFYVAFRIPNLLRRLTAEGALTTGFVPIFTDYLTRRGKDEALRITRVIATFAVVTLGAVTVLGMIFAAPLTRLFAPGFATDPEKFSLTVFLTRLMFPYIFFISLVALAMGVLNSIRHFMAPALSPVLLNLSIILCAFLLPPLLDEPAISLGYGVLLGGIVQLLLQLPYLSREGLRYAPDYHFRDPALKRLLLLMAPTVFGAAVYQVNVLVSTVLASMLPEGSVSYLYYADRFLQFPLGVFAVALGTAVLPSFSSLVARREHEELKSTLSYSLQISNCISLPCTLGLMVLAVPVLSLLFQRGAFDAQTTLSTAQALIYFSLGLWGVSGAKLVIPVFYAMEDTRTPVWVGFWSFVFNLLLSLVFMGPISVSPESNLLLRSVAALSQSLNLFSLSHGGLALATSVSSTCQFLVLLLILDRRLGGFPWNEFWRSFGRSLLSSSLMAAPLVLLAGRIDWLGAGNSLLTRGAVFLVMLGSGVVIYLALTFVIRGPEHRIVEALLRWARGRFLGKTT